MTYDSSTSTVVCKFLNQPSTVMTTRSCRIDYWQCRQGSINLKAIQENTTSDIATINLEMLHDSSQTYCYTITASNGTHIIKVEGQIGKQLFPFPQLNL